MIIATIRDFDGEHYPVDSNNKMIKNLEYLTIAQPEKEPDNGFNLVLQNQETGELFFAYSIDFNFDHKETD